MKSATHLTATDSRATKSRPVPQPFSEFVSVAETDALLAGSASARQRRLDAGDMITTDVAAAMTGTSRVTVNAWIKKGRAIGLSQAKRGYRLPAWQFDAPVWDVLPKLSAALGIKEGWGLLSFLETPLGGLDGATPRQALERLQADRVVELASRGI